MKKQQSTKQKKNICQRFDDTLVLIFSCTNWYSDSQFYEFILFRLGIQIQFWSWKQRTKWFCALMISSVYFLAVLIAPHSALVDWWTEFWICKISRLVWLGICFHCCFQLFVNGQCGAVHNPIKGKLIVSFNRDGLVGFTQTDKKIKLQQSPKGQMNGCFSADMVELDSDLKTQ